MFSLAKRGAYLMLPWNIVCFHSLDGTKERGQVNSHRLQVLAQRYAKEFRIDRSKEKPKDHLWAFSWLSHLF